MVRDEGTTQHERADRRVGERPPRGPGASISLESSARRQWEETVHRVTPDLWATVIAEGFGPVEATIVCRLAWLSLAQDWHPQNTSDEDVRRLFASVVERQRRLSDARALRGTSGLTPGGAARLVAL